MVVSNELPSFQLTLRLLFVSFNYHGYARLIIMRKSKFKEYLFVFWNIWVEEFAKISSSDEAIFILRLIDLKVFHTENCFIVFIFLYFVWDFMSDAIINQEFTWIDIKIIAFLTTYPSKSVLSYHWGPLPFSLWVNTFINSFDNLSQTLGFVLEVL